MTLLKCRGACSRSRANRFVKQRQEESCSLAKERKTCAMTQLMSSTVLKLLCWCCGAAKMSDMPSAAWSPSSPVRRAMCTSKKAEAGYGQLEEAEADAPPASRGDG